MNRFVPVVIRHARNLAAMPRLVARSFAATRYAAGAGAPGIQFAAFGRSLGLRALVALERGALDLLLTPVSIVRYWEFPFVLRLLPKRPGRCLDISSPRLFSFFVASRMQPSMVRMLTPRTRPSPPRI